MHFDMLPKVTQEILRCSPRLLRATQAHPTKPIKSNLKSEPWMNYLDAHKHAGAIGELLEILLDHSKYRIPSAEDHLGQRFQRC